MVTFLDVTTCSYVGSFRRKVDSSRLRYLCEFKLLSVLFVSRIELDDPLEI